jgi:hypothetical protein
MIRKLAIIALSIFALIGCLMLLVLRSKVKKEAELRQLLNAAFPAGYSFIDSDDYRRQNSILAYIEYLFQYDTSKYGVYVLSQNKTAMCYIEKTGDWQIIKNINATPN